MSFAIAVSLIMVVGYLAYVGYAGSQLFASRAHSGDCRTPASAFGWSYEAINYDIASDGALDAIENRRNCSLQGQAAGTELTASDGVRIAGWYVPAADEAGPAAPTVVLAHAHDTNKSSMLEWAEALHASYNLVLFDFRNSGQSSGDHTTLGVREVRDLQAVVDWLEEAKAPISIALLGVSTGGAAVIDEAASDPRVAAVILDSIHATLANALQARLARDGFPLSLPAAWSILLGGLLRTGEDMSSADPIQAIGRYGERPLLIIAAGNDDAVGPNDATDLLAAARADGAHAELQTCPGARHAKSIESCGSEYAGWVLDFLGRSMSQHP